MVALQGRLRAAEQRGQSATPARPGGGPGAVRKAFTWAMLPSPAIAWPAASFWLRGAYPSARPSGRSVSSRGRVIPLGRDLFQPDLARRSAVVRRNADR
jgi:hypothetical protein